MPDARYLHRAHPRVVAARKRCAGRADHRSIPRRGGRLSAPRSLRPRHDASPELTRHQRDGAAGHSAAAIVCRGCSRCSHRGGRARNTHCWPSPRCRHTLSTITSGPRGAVRDGHPAGLLAVCDGSTCRWPTRCRGAQAGRGAARGVRPGQRRHGDPGGGRGRATPLCCRRRRRPHNGKCVRGSRQRLPLPVALERTCHGARECRRAGLRLLAATADVSATCSRRRRTCWPAHRLAVRSEAHGCRRCGCRRRRRIRVPIYAGGEPQPGHRASCACTPPPTPAPE